MSNILLDPEYKQLLTEHYNIINVSSSASFDCGKIDNLVQTLTHTKKTQYDPKDRYVIVWFDTDFYWHGHGINLNNMFTVWRSLNIPFFTMLLYTNHFGLHKEVNELCKLNHNRDRPTVIETFINPGNYNPKGYEDYKIDLELIEKHALCMMAGSPRSHRYATYNAVKHLVPEQIEMTIRGV
jgi:hypothetical protein